MRPVNYNEGFIYKNKIIWYFYTQRGFIVQEYNEN